MEALFTIQQKIPEICGRLFYFAGAGLPTAISRLLGRAEREEKIMETKRTAYYVGLVRKMAVGRK